MPIIFCISTVRGLQKSQIFTLFSLTVKVQYSTMISTTYKEQNNSASHSTLWLQIITFWSIFCTLCMCETGLFVCLLGMVERRGLEMKAFNQLFRRMKLSLMQESAVRLLLWPAMHLNHCHWEQWGEGGKERRSKHQSVVSYKAQTKYKLPLSTQSLYQIISAQP